MRQPSSPVQALSMNSLRSAWTGTSVWPNQPNIRAKPVFATGKTKNMLDGRGLLMEVNFVAAGSLQEPQTPQRATGALAGPTRGIANKGLVFFGRGGAI